MTAAEVHEVRLQDEIADLKSALNDVPAPLRDQGLFASYESRLALLQEQLLSVRLGRLIQKYESTEAGVLDARELSAERRTAEEISRAAAAIEQIRRSKHRSALGYRTLYFLLAAGVLVVSGILLATELMTALHVAVSPLVLLLLGFALSQALMRHLEIVWTEAENQLEVLRNQLETLSSVYNARQTPEPKVYERTLALLDQAHVE